MNKRARELIKYGKLCGFEYEGIDGNDHHVLVHPNGARVRVAGTPGDYRGDRNTEAEMRRLSGVTPPRPNSGKYRRGIGKKPEIESSGDRVDSWSHQVAVLQKRHRQLCGEVTQAHEDGWPIDDLLHRLDALEAEFAKLNARPPVRSCRIYTPK